MILVGQGYAPTKSGHKSRFICAAQFHGRLVKFRRISGLRVSVIRALKHPLSPFKRRALYSIGVVVIVVAVGTEVMHVLEGWSYVDSFYFISLLATTQGPTIIPRTDIGKFFAALIAFVSVGVVLSSIVFVAGPVIGSVLKVGMDFAEKEEKRLKSAAERGKRRRKGILC